MSFKADLRSAGFAIAALASCSYPAMAANRGVPMDGHDMPFKKDTYVMWYDANGLAVTEARGAGTEGPAAVTRDTLPYSEKVADAQQ